MALESGDPLVFRCNFRVAGVLTDPTDVVLTITSPDGTSADFDYPEEVGRESTGKYSKTVTGETGWYYWKWTGTGACQAVHQGAVEVSPSIT